MYDGSKCQLTSCSEACRLPNDLKVYWQQYPWGLGEPVCKMRAFIAEMTGYASVLTIVAFTIERYIAICHPLFLQKMPTLQRAIKFITSVWITSCLCALPFAYYTRINYIDYPIGSGNYLKESAYCGLPMEIQHITRPLLQAATFIFFFFPLTLILILYIKISLKLRRNKFAMMASENSKSGTSNRVENEVELRKSEIRRSVNKMLIAVVIAFFICWAPFHAQRLLAVYVAPEDWTVTLRRANEILYYAAGCFYYISSTINPILYTSMSSKYRGAFMSTLRCFMGRKTSNGSITLTSQHTQHRHDTLHLDKELSTRVSKQSFAADASVFAHCRQASLIQPSSLSQTQDKLSPVEEREVNGKRQSLTVETHSDENEEERENNKYRDTPYSNCIGKQIMLVEEAKQNPFRTSEDTVAHISMKDMIVNVDGINRQCSQERKGCTANNKSTLYNKSSETFV
ncbi:neuropeptides capa receptor-like [Uloborus diversus]|uniref:neuropeptides capa receptor-like n=1 Tax=Uloborus diversus TaxID=327109 RepID=UPI00240A94EE|nr:neuropeptides capa receptor-like [Uloborus diversus]